MGGGVVVLAWECCAGLWISSWLEGIMLVWGYLAELNSETDYRVAGKLFQYLTKI